MKFDQMNLEVLFPTIAIQSEVIRTHKVVLFLWQADSLYFCQLQFKPATIHLFTIRYVSRYRCHDTVHDTIRSVTTKQEGYWLVSCLWAQKSVQLTSLVASMHACVVCTILNMMLNTVQHGFFSSVCSESRCA